MTLQSSGQISMSDIVAEKGATAGSSAINISLHGLSVDGVSDYQAAGSAIMIDTAGSPNQVAPYHMSEFHGFSMFSWGTPRQTIGQATPFTSNYGYMFNLQDNVDYGSQRDVATSCSIRLETSSNRVAYGLFASQDDGTSPYSTPQAEVIYTGTLSKIEVRWVYTGVTFNIEDGSGSDGTAHIGESYETNDNTTSAAGHILDNDDITAAGNVVTTADTTYLLDSLDGTNVNRTGPWVDFGADDLRTKSTMLWCSADSYTNNYWGAYAGVSSGSSGTIKIQLRANQDNNSIVTLFTKSGSWSQYAQSTDEPDFTCIMPDMLVKEETQGLIRIGDIAVGDRILAKGDLNDDSVADQYVEVTEARTHTREGYWDVEGLQITNDHPVWLSNSDKTDRQWVNVEDMKEEISRTYVSGQVDPVYLGTNPGWYYVYTATNGHETRTHKTTVSGNYAPTTE